MNFIIIIVVLIALVILNNHSNVGKELQIKKPRTKEQNLIETLTNISAGDKVTLRNITEKWSLNKKVIDEDLKHKLLTIIKRVINGTSISSGNKYYVKTIENVYIMKDNNGDFRAIMSCFMYDIMNYHTIKLMMDIVSVDRTIFINHVDIDESGVKNVLNNYDIKLNSQGILSHYDMFDEDTRVMLDDYYRTNFKMVELSKEDYETDRTNIFTLDQLVNNYLPANVPVEDSPTFCNKYSDEWDSSSIPKKGTENCTFQNPGIRAYPNSPYDAPGLVTNNVDDNIYSWLHEPNRKHNIPYN
jgi:hypothetical protein